MTTDPRQFVESLDLMFPGTQIDRIEAMEEPTINVRGLGGLESVAEEKEKAFVNAGSLISFVSNVEEQNRSDVLNSTLIAQLAADHLFPDEEQIINWYEKYFEVLSKIGWNFEMDEFAEFEMGGNVFEMHNAVLDVLGAAIGGAHVALVAKTMDALRKLSDTDNKLILFEKKSHSLTKGNFQIGLVNETNGAISMAMGAFIVDTHDRIGRVLFFKSSKENTKLSHRLAKGTLVTDVYEVVRGAILQKLADKAKNFVAELDIGF